MSHTWHHDPLLSRKEVSGLLGLHCCNPGPLTSHQEFNQEAVSNHSLGEFWLYTVKAQAEYSNQQRVLFKRSAWPFKAQLKGCLFPAIKSNRQAGWHHRSTRGWPTGRLYSSGYTHTVSHTRTPEVLTSTRHANMLWHEALTSHDWVACFMTSQAKVKSVSRPCRKRKACGRTEK